MADTVIIQLSRQQAEVLIEDFEYRFDGLVPYPGDKAYAQREEILRSVKEQLELQKPNPKPDIRFTDKEASMYVVAAMSYGLPVNANFFASHFKSVSRKRAEELEAYQRSFTKPEADLISTKLNSPEAKS